MNQVIMRSKTVRDIYLNISHFLDHFIMLIFAKAAYDAGKYFGLSYDEIIVYGTLSFVFFGAFAPLASYLADKFSRALLMVIYHFGIAVASIIAGISSSLFILSLSLAIIGIFASIYHPVGTAMLLAKNERTGFRLGINGVYGNMGVAAAPLVLGTILLFGDWRTCFIIPGIFCLIYGIIFFAALENNPSLKQTELTQLNRSFAKNWQWALASISISTLAGGFIFGAMTFIIPRYFEIYLIDISTSVAVTGALAAAVYACASFSQIVVGKLIDIYSPKIILLYTAVGQIIFIFFASALHNWYLFFISLVAICFVFGQIPINDAILSRYIPDEKRGKILSIKFLLNLCVGAAVLPISSLLMQNGYEFNTIFILMGGMAVFILLAALILPNQTEVDRLDKIY
ncbi:MAG: MFS transporter [Euryarchaeota archaeon]|nr:MFS transporter [Euryarchaeota archaeon]